MFSYAQLSISNRRRRIRDWFSHSVEFYVNLLFDRSVYRPIRTHMGHCHQLRPTSTFSADKISSFKFEIIRIPASTSRTVKERKAMITTKRFIGTANQNVAHKRRMNFTSFSWDWDTSLKTLLPSIECT